MRSAIEIRLGPRDFQVTTGGQTARFRTIDEALDFARQRLRLAQEVRELSMRCE